MTLAIQLTPIIFPVLFLMVIAGLLICVLNTEGQFGWPAYAGVLVPIATTLFVLVAGSRIGVGAIAIGTLAGVCLQLGVLIYRMRCVRISYRPVMDWRRPEVGLVFVAAWPALLGATVNQASPLVDQIFASFLSAGSISTLNYANKITSRFGAGPVMDAYFVASGLPILLVLLAQVLTGAITLSIILVYAWLRSPRPRERTSAGFNTVVNLFLLDTSLHMLVLRMVRCQPLILTAPAQAAPKMEQDVQFISPFRVVFTRRRLLLLVDVMLCIGLLGAASGIGGYLAPPSSTSPAPSTSATSTSAMLTNAPDTSSNIHIGLPSTCQIISSGQALLSANPPVREVWNWCGDRESMTSYPSIYAGRYFPVDRQPDTRYYPGAQPLSWFQANHPDWLEYKCDRSTVAYEFGQTTDIPLDTSNPAALAWLESTFYTPAATSGFGHLDFDNFQMTNGGSWSGQRCGHWTGAAGSSTWVAQYNGTNSDPAYRTNEAAMAQHLQAWLHASHPSVAFAANFSYDNSYPSDSDSLMSHVDLLFDEQGFTNGNNAPPYNYTGATWVAKAQHTWSFISAGHGWQDINQFGSAFSTLSTAQKQWALANYLLLKNNASWLYICGPQEYGTLLMTSEYAAQIGSPTGAYYASQSVYQRDFSNGLALVNPSASTSSTVTLSGAHHDLYGNAVGSQVTLGPASGLVLLNG